jgi:hypothetical protein
MNKYGYLHDLMDAAITGDMTIEDVIEAYSKGGKQIGKGNDQRNVGPGGRLVAKRAAHRTSRKIAKRALQRGEEPVSPKYSGYES